ncbi:DUF72 domain-containing protein [Bradyrhizobium rifense]|uniref:DUF72 domain-containing protein n=1 Tax=Bradyrhizobium rifense TaxID=515499 RepID=A0A5D3K048_9BRAD|nr:DUF72 domain-containing protein [Bradyrhizobium rifense]TYL85661.1 DUF72 domain-containing protein [Bradyrhizobium rifense]
MECAVSLPRADRRLTSYASILNAVEINSSFYRPHSTTYERWASATPNDFPFSVKVPRSKQAEWA